MLRRFPQRWRYGFGGGLSAASSSALHVWAAPHARHLPTSVALGLCGWLALTLVATFLAPLARLSKRAELGLLCLLTLIGLPAATLTLLLTDFHLGLHLLALLVAFLGGCVVTVKEAADARPPDPRRLEGLSDFALSLLAQAVEKGSLTLGPAHAVTRQAAKALTKNRFLYRPDSARPGLLRPHPAAARLLAAERERRAGLEPDPVAPLGPRQRPSGLAAS